MAKKARFDLDFRPRSYWAPHSLKKCYGTHLTELRRKAVMEEADDYEGSNTFLGSSLPDNVRGDLGAVHPLLTSGEYLPPVLENEVETARVVLAPTMGDLASIRARQFEDKNLYRTVDKYMEEGEDRFVAEPENSTARPSLREVIFTINQSGLVDGPRDMNYGGGMGYNDVYNFATVSSEFYPN